MNKSTLSYISLILIAVSILLNILIYFTIIPSFIFSINNGILMILLLIILWKRKKSKDTDKILTILGFIFIFILFFTDFLILIKFKC